MIYDVSQIISFDILKTHYETLPIVDIKMNFEVRYGIRKASKGTLKTTTKSTAHSGRRTFITQAAKKISSVGGSMRDVQMLARHNSLNMTMRYVEADKEAMRRVVDLV